MDRLRLGLGGVRTLKRVSAADRRRVPNGKRPGASAKRPADGPKLSGYSRTARYGRWLRNLHRALTPKTYSAAVPAIRISRDIGYELGTGL